MSYLKALADIRIATGKHIRLGMFESVANFRIEPDHILLAINRVWYRESRGTFIVTKRGTTLYEWKRSSTGGWKMSDPFTLCWSISPEVHTSRNHLTPEEDAAQREWEDSCYRPGTARSPMDNVPRRKQGIK